MKVAFIFFFVKDHKQHQLWQQFFEHADQNKYNIYVHSKFPENCTSFFQDYLISTVDTNYEHITNAIFHSLEIALENENNQMFVLVSDSCIPLHSFDIIFETLIRKEKSWIHLWRMQDYDLKKRYRETFQYVEQNEIFPQEYLIKHSSWLALNYNDCQLIVQYKEWHKFFETMEVGNEFFCSILNYHYSNLMQETNFEEIIENNYITYASWIQTNDKINALNDQLRGLYSKLENNNYNSSVESLLNYEIGILKRRKNQLRSHPHEYSTLTEDIVNTFKNKALFLRKIAEDSNINEFTHYLLDI